VVPEVSPPRTALLARLDRLIRFARSPDSGVLGQGLRFVLAGGTVAFVYTASTLALVHVAGFSFELALAVGFVLAIATHFTLQRFFVWVHHTEFALDLRPQVSRYLAAALTQYGLTAASVAVLPGALHVAPTWVYLVTVAVVSTVMFFVLRHVVFHAGA
jgi:putative flippase GtrA